MENKNNMDFLIKIKPSSKINKIVSRCIKLLKKFNIELKLSSIGNAILKLLKIIDIIQNKIQVIIYHKFSTVYDKVIENNIIIDCYINLKLDIILTPKNEINEAKIYREKSRYNDQKYSMARLQERSMYLLNNIRKENMNNNDIVIIYKKNKNEKQIQIFGSKFAENNKDKCKIVYEKENEFIYDNNCEIKLQDTFQSDKDIIIRLKGISKIKDMSYMFYFCNSLEYLPNIYKFNTSNVIDMSYLFFNCSSLKYLNNISKWDTSNVTNMSHMFYYCTSLSSISDISIWNTSNVTNMSYMFYFCKLLKCLPDISKWNLSKVNNMNYMFCCCESLSSFPRLSNDLFNEYKLKLSNESLISCCSYLKERRLLNIIKYSKKMQILLNKTLYNYQYYYFLYLIHLFNNFIKRNLYISYDFDSKEITIEKDHTNLISYINEQLEQFNNFEFKNYQKEISIYNKLIKKFDEKLIFESYINILSDKIKKMTFKFSNSKVKKNPYYDGYFFCSEKDYIMKGNEFEHLKYISNSLEKLKIQ